MFSRTRRKLLALVGGTTLAGAVPPTAAAQTAKAGPVVDETWADAARKREVPIRLRWPDPAVHAGPRPVLLFSHGLGGTREGGAVWGETWAAAGFVVLHLQHPGSDLAAVRSTARLGDVTFALGEITRRHADGQERWASGDAAARERQLSPQGLRVGDLWEQT